MLRYLNVYSGAIEVLGGTTNIARAFVRMQLFCLIFLSGALFANGGPYVVEDVEALDRGECHVEAWYSYQNSDNAISVLAPACNLGGIEWTFMAERVNEWGDPATYAVLEAKYAARPIVPGGVGVAAILGLGSGESLRRGAEGYLTIPVSYELMDALRLHVNIGAIYAREDSDWSSTWGVGFDWEVFSELSIIGEHFGDDGGFNAWQIGLRPHVINDSVLLDLTWGRNLEGTAGNWFTVGLIWEI